MAISTYSELVAQVVDDLHRNDLSSKIANFIVLAESRMNRVLRLTCQETVDDLTCTSRYTTLPSDLLELRSVEYGGTPLLLLTNDSPEYMTLINEGSTGIPRSYAIRGSTIELYPAPTSASLNLTYYAKVGPLTSNTPTTAVLTYYPDIYYFGTMLYAALHARDSELGAAMNEAFVSAMDDAMRADNRRKYPGPLQIRVA